MRSQYVKMTKPMLRQIVFAGLLLVAPQLRAEQCIGFVPSGGGGIFWKGVSAGAAEAGKALGYDIYFRGPSEEDKADIQATVLELIRERGCKAVVVAPGSAELAPSVASLKTAGVPVIYVDRALDGAPAAGMIGTDNYKAGHLAGEAMARSLGGKGAVLLFRMRRGLATTDQRERGFADAAVSNGLRVIDGGYLGSVYGEAFVNGSRMLARYKGKFSGVFAPNEATSMGVLAALREQRLAGRVSYIAVDVTDQLLDALRGGAVQGLVVQAPHAIGYQAVQMAAAAIERKLPPRRSVMVDAVYLTKGNLDSYFP